MSTIRKQSIYSTLVIYGGFIIGLVNTYLFTRKGIFTEEEFGLYNVLIAIALLLAAVGNMGAPYFIYKFFPYYKDRSGKNQNDQLTLALLLGIVVVLVVSLVLVLKQLNLKILKHIMLVTIGMKSLVVGRITDEENCYGCLVLFLDFYDCVCGVRHLPLCQR